MILDRKKQVGNPAKPASRSHDSPTPSESSISVGEDVVGTYERMIELTKSEGCSTLHSQAYVRPHKTLLDLLLEEDELNSVYIY